MPLRASELGISKLTLQFSQSVEEAVAIPTQLLFGWLLRRYTMAFKTVGLINGVLWGLGLLALGLWVREEDSARFYWTHAIWGVGYGAYIVNDVAKATMAPKKVFTLGVISGCHIAFGAYLMLTVGGARTRPLPRLPRPSP